MAKIISLESRRAEHTERVRQQALAGFPWNELTEYTRAILHPVTSRLPVNKRWMVEDSITARLRILPVGDPCESANLLGSAERGRNIPLEGECGEGFPGGRGPVDSQTAHDFQLFQVLDEWLSQSVIIVMEDMMPRWLVRGAEYESPAPETAEDLIMQPCSRRCCVRRFFT